MKPAIALITVTLLLAPRAALLAADTPETAAKPNIILILADDLGAKELACYGNTEHRTPNLDRMAAEGMRFETFYVNPLCTPTRVALMTGQYGFHNGFLGMQDPAFKPDPKSPQAQIGNHFTHADVLKSRGYATALVGKWQLSGVLPTLIHDAGFDEYPPASYPPASLPPRPPPCYAIPPSVREFPEATPSMLATPAPAGWQRGSNELAAVPTTGPNRFGPVPFFARGQLASCQTPTSGPSAAC